MTKKPETVTKCFTYEVTMIVQVLATDEKAAKDQLDSQGGYLTKRDVKLINTINLPNGEN